MSDRLAPPIATREIYTGRIFSVRTSDYRRPDGLVVSRDVIDHPGAVCVVAVDGDSLLLVRQSREAVERRILELPAGKLEVGEDPLACAKRELAEEVGRQGARWESLGTVLTAPAIITEVIHIFLAEDLTTASAEGDPDEDIEVVRWPLADLRVLIETLEDAKSLAGVIRFAHRWG